MARARSRAGIQAGYLGVELCIDANIREHPDIAGKVLHEHKIRCAVIRRAKIGRNHGRRDCFARRVLLVERNLFDERKQVNAE